MIPLGLLANGERGVIVEIREEKRCRAHHRHKEGHRNGQCRVEDMGIRVGKKVEMLNNERRGLVLLKVGESRIALGRGMAMGILIRRGDNDKSVDA